jgi:hypothetical protein
LHRRRQILRRACRKRQQDRKGKKKPRRAHFQEMECRVRVGNGQALHIA